MGWNRHFSGPVLKLSFQVVKLKVFRNSGRARLEAGGPPYVFCWNISRFRESGWREPSVGSGLFTLVPPVRVPSSSLLFVGGEAGAQRIWLRAGQPTSFLSIQVVRAAFSGRSCRRDVEDPPSARGGPGAAARGSQAEPPGGPGKPVRGGARRHMHRGAQGSEMTGDGHPWRSVLEPRSGLEGAGLFRVAGGERPPGWGPMIALLVGGQVSCFCPWPAAPRAQATWPDAENGSSGPGRGPTSVGVKVSCHPRPGGFGGARGPTKLFSPRTGAFLDVEGADHTALNPKNRGTSGCWGAGPPAASGHGPVTTQNRVGVPGVVPPRLERARFVIARVRRRGPDPGKAGLGRNGLPTTAAASNPRGPDRCTERLCGSNNRRPSAASPTSAQSCRRGLRVRRGPLPSVGLADSARWIRPDDVYGLEPEARSTAPRPARKGRRLGHHPRQDFTPTAPGNRGPNRERKPRGLAAHPLSRWKVGNRGLRLNREVREKNTRGRGNLHAWSPFEEKPPGPVPSWRTTVEGCLYKKGRGTATTACHLGVPGAALRPRDHEIIVWSPAEGDPTKPRDRAEGSSGLAGASVTSAPAPGGRPKPCQSPKPALFLRFGGKPGPGQVPAKRRPPARPQRPGPWPEGRRVTGEGLGGLAMGLGRKFEGVGAGRGLRRQRSSEPRPRGGPFRGSSPGLWPAKTPMSTNPLLMRRF